MPANPAQVSVTEPLSPALRRVKSVLFAPFDIKKWFVIGFCAWLSSCGEGGGGGGGGTGHNRGRSVQAADIRHGLEQAWDYVVDNLAWILPLVILGLLVCLFLWLVAIWLNSHGKFMLLHSVALNRAEIQVPWEQFAPHAHSLFVFQALLGGISFLIIFPILIASITVLFLGFMKESGMVGPAALFVLGILCVLVVGVAFGIVKKLLVDFVVPIMYLRTPRVREAWRELLQLVSANLGRFVLYLLFSVVLALMIGTLVLLVVVATCCIAGCLMAIPYIGAVLLLPVSVFKRAYALYYLEQYGAEYRVIQEAPVPPAAPGGMAPL